MAAFEDGIGHPDVERVSRIGNRGKCTQDCHRDLQRIMQTSSLMPSRIKVNLSWKVSDAVTTVMEQAIILPHLLFSLIYKLHPETFVEQLCGNANRIAEFWSEMTTHPSWPSHPIRKRRDRGMIIPIATHGDGVPVKGLGKSWSQKVEIYSWSSLLAEGSTIFTHMLIALQYCTAFFSA